MRACKTNISRHLLVPNSSVGSNFFKKNFPQKIQFTKHSITNVVSNSTSHILNLWLTRQISAKKYYKRESSIADKLAQYRKNEQISRLHAGIEELQQIWEIPEPQKPLEHELNIFIHRNSLDFFQKAYSVAVDLNIPEKNVFLRVNKKDIPWSIALGKLQQSVLDEILEISGSKIDKHDKEQLLQDSQQLAQKHNVGTKTEFSFFISATRDRVPSLCIQQTSTKGSVYVSFHEGFADYRRRFGKNRRSPMVRAVRTGSGKSLSQTTVVDATGGFGMDAFVLCCVGCQVTVCEKNPIIFRLLKDGYERGMQTKEVREILERMRILNVDSKEYMMSLPEEERPDIVYLDPMYPSKKKMKSQVRKEMQIIRQIAEKTSQDRTNQLIEIAQQCAKKCVILKRPFYVPVDLSCNRSYKSKSTHFDVFLAKPRHGIEETTS